MTVYKHLVGKERAEQEFYLGDLSAHEHPERPDFIDESVLVDLSNRAEKFGIPVPEFADDDVKQESEASFDATIPSIVLTGAVTDLANLAARTFTATLKHDTTTQTGDDTTSVTFVKVSGTGAGSGLGAATATDGVATKEFTASGTGTYVIKATAPGYPESNTLSFNIV